MYNSSRDTERPVYGYRAVCCAWTILALERRKAERWNNNNIIIIIDKPN